MCSTISPDVGFTGPRPASDRRRSTTAQDLPDLEFFHVDVFTDRPLGGNGVIVFPDAASITGDLMLRLTQEMRQFESIFLGTADAAGRSPARIFTTEEELEFAGHPILGAATVLHFLHGGDAMRSTFVLAGRHVDVSTTRNDTTYTASMNQGPPRSGDPISDSQGCRGAASTQLAP